MERQSCRASFHAFHSKMHLESNRIFVEEGNPSAQRAQPAQVSSFLGASVHARRAVAALLLVAPVYMLFVVFLFPFATECESADPLPPPISDHSIFEDDSFVSYADDDVTAQPSYDGEEEIFSLAYANREKGRPSYPDSQRKVGQNDAFKADGLHPGGGTLQEAPVAYPAIHADPERSALGGDPFHTFTTQGDTTTATRTSYNVASDDCARGTSSGPSSASLEPAGNARHTDMVAASYSLTDQGSATEPHNAGGVNIAPAAPPTGDALLNGAGDPGAPMANDSPRFAGEGMDVAKDANERRTHTPQHDQKWATFSKRLTRFRLFPGLRGRRSSWMRGDAATASIRARQTKQGLILGLMALVSLGVVVSIMRRKNYLPAVLTESGYVSVQSRT
ncbi:putative transmembrane protein [Toxoplasma gondii CAST]|uniref:Putative transmembrane protein n=1 Tax=Toxoplasma gondii CAST TaxID=943122 RepID=A0A3R8AJ53_TOXGO|nr:putative transmembrane protein [Toxoplasma gondii CAST]